MNVFLWTLQVVLALHTAVGAVWKWSNSERAMPSLGAIPHGLWLAMSILELLCAAGLIVPAFSKRFAVFAPIAASFVAAEMLLFSGLHLASGASRLAPVIYWLVVTAISACIIFGRLVRTPIRRSEFA